MLSPNKAKEKVMEQSIGIAFVFMMRQWGQLDRMKKEYPPAVGVSVLVAFSNS